MKDFSQDLCKSPKYHSKFKLRPLYGQTREISLNRTEYRILNSANDLFIQESFYLYLPTLRSIELDLSLKWRELEGKKYYFLESLNELPFKINGNIVLRAIITNGDKVDIAHNRIEFNSEVNGLNDEIGICERVIKSKLNILLEGETGTGKSYIAKKIHEESGRMGPFIHLNLASFSKNLIESEIFGHVKGAFTGAIHNKAGALKEADYGTLFLDEIDSLSLDLQTKLLLFLDSNKFRSVGDNRETSVDVRIIFASGQSLEKMVQDKFFRKDMYFRISSGAVKRLRPLRKDEVRLKRLLLDFQRERDYLISNRLINYYCRISWPGNIRQLLGHLEKKTIMTNGRKLDFDFLDEELLLSSIGLTEEGLEDYISYKELKLNYFNRVFTRVNGDYREAARRLDVSINTVKNVLAKTG